MSSQAALTHARTLARSKCPQYGRAQVSFGLAPTPPSQILVTPAQHAPFKTLPRLSTSAPFSSLLHQTLKAIHQRDQEQKVNKPQPSQWSKQVRNPRRMSPSERVQSHFIPTESLHHTTHPTRQFERVSGVAIGSDVRTLMATTTTGPSSSNLDVRPRSAS